MLINLMTIKASENIDINENLIEDNQYTIENKVMGDFNYTLKNGVQISKKDAEKAFNEFNIKYIKFKNECEEQYEIRIKNYEKNFIYTLNDNVKLNIEEMFEISKDYTDKADEEKQIEKV